MLNGKSRWMMVSAMILTLLAGCEHPGGGKLSLAATSPPAAPPAGMPSVDQNPSGKPFDNGDASYTIKTGDGIALAGNAPTYQVDASYFAGDQAGWMIIETDKGKPALLHTNDGGGVWSQKEIPGERGEAVHFIDERKGFAMVSTACGVVQNGGVERCAKEELLSTADGGGTWQIVWESPELKTDFTGAELAFPDGASGYALTRDGKLLVSHDKGLTWKTVVAGSDSFRVSHMSFVSAMDGWAVGTTETKGADGGSTMTLQVWKTADAGVHWQRQFQQSDGLLGSSGISFYDKSNGYVAVGDYDTMRGQLMRTTDGGVHWMNVGELKPSRPAPSGIRLLSATEGWIPLNVGAGPIDGGLIYFSDGGSKMVTLKNGFSSLRDAVPTGGGKGWALAESPQGFRTTVLKTEDGGQSWKQVWPAPHPIADVTFIDDKHGFGIGRESDSGAFMRTDDGGVTWQVVSELGASGYRLYFSGLQHGWVLGTTDEGTKPRLMETTDGGITWRVDTESLPEWNSLPQTAELKFSSDTEGVLVYGAARELRVLRTSDGGKSWTTVSSQTDANSLHTLSIMSGNELRETSLLSKPDKTHWLQLSRLAIGNGSWQQLGRLQVDDSLLSAVYPSEKTGAVWTERWIAGGIEPHLLYTSDGGRTWSDRMFPASAELDWSSPARFGARSDTAWWLLMQGHLLQTNDAGAHWSIAY